MQQSISIRHAQAVQAQFEGRAFANFKESCQLIGIAQQTGRHMLIAGTFPVAVTRIGGKLLVPVGALLAEVERMLTGCGVEPTRSPEPAPATPPTSAPIKRKPGRPRKMMSEGEGSAK